MNVLPTERGTFFALSNKDLKMIKRSITPIEYKFETEGGKKFSFFFQTEATFKIARKRELEHEKIAASMKSKIKPKDEKQIVDAKIDTNIDKVDIVDEKEIETI